MVERRGNDAQTVPHSLTRFTVGCWLFPNSLDLLLRLYPGVWEVMDIPDIPGIFPER